MTSSTERIVAVSLIVIAVISILALLSPLAFLLNWDVKDFKITGKVANKIDRKPIENAQITVTNWYYGQNNYDGYSDHEIFTAVSNANGDYVLTIKRGAYLEIHVEKEEFVRDTTYLYPEKKTTVNFKLTPKQEVSPTQKAQ